MVMVYSASIAIAEAGRYTGNHPTYYLVRHGVFPGDRAGGGRCRLSGAARDLATDCALAIRRRLHPADAGADSRALVVTSNGARRWISLSFVNPQPSEFMKLFRRAVRR